MEFAQLKLERGDVIFNRTNSTELVGKTTYWSQDFDAVIASYLVKLRLKKEMLSEFFVALMNMPHYKSMFQERCKKAVGQSNISPTLLKEFPIFVPPLSKQEEFASVVRRVESLRGRMAESERQVEGLFESLLSQSFGGG
jgi:type I restriction enzyme S subunit